MKIKLRDNSRGMTLIEVLISLVIMTIAAVGTLTIFSSQLGGVNREGNRRAALERAREQVEQLMESSTTSLKPSDMETNWLSCSGSPCTWTRSAIKTTQSVAVHDLNGMPMETTVRWVDDPAASTITQKDALEFTVKVWFLGNDATLDDGYHRAIIKTLRAPS